MRAAVKVAAVTGIYLAGAVVTTTILKEEWSWLLATTTDPEHPKRDEASEVVDAVVYAITERQARTGRHVTPQDIAIASGIVWPVLVPVAAFIFVRDHVHIHIEHN